MNLTAFSGFLAYQTLDKELMNHIDDCKNEQWLRNDGGLCEDVIYREEGKNNKEQIQ